MKTRIPLKITNCKTLFALILGLVFSACENGPLPPKNDKRSADEVKKVVTLRNEFGSMQNFINESFGDALFKIDSGGRARFRKSITQRVSAYSLCADTSGVETSNGSMVLTMDFGDGCESENGSVLAGQAIVTMNFSNDMPTSYQVKLINYREIDDNPATVNGEYNASRFTIDTTGFLFYFQEIDQDLNLTYKDGSRALFSSSEKIEITGDTIRIPECTSVGSFSNGDKFNTSIVKPLIYDLLCAENLPVAGIETLIFNDDKTDIDYGNGECDSDYVVTPK